MRSDGEVENRGGPRYPCSHSFMPNSLPSSLFLVTNMTVLSLRKSTIRVSLSRYSPCANGTLGANRLERLPAGVGQLKRLKELNVSNNLIVRRGSHT